MDYTRWWCGAKTITTICSEKNTNSTNAVKQNYLSLGQNKKKRIEKGRAGFLYIVRALYYVEIVIKMVC